MVFTIKHRGKTCSFSLEAADRSLKADVAVRPLGPPKAEAGDHYGDDD